MGWTPSGRASGRTRTCATPSSESSACPLYITGRDVDETEMALHFHAAAGAWQLLDGPTQDFTLGDTRSAVLRHLRAKPQVNTPKMIADVCGIAYDTVKKTCQRVPGDTPESTGSVPGVPLDQPNAVTSINTRDHGGHPNDQAVPHVPLDQFVVQLTSIGLEFGL